MQRLIAKSVPTFMDPENAKSLFDNAEFWMGAQGILGVDKSLVESQWFCMVLFFCLSMTMSTPFTPMSYVISFGGQFFGWGRKT